jgi:hypothetical protein
MSLNEASKRLRRNIDDYPEVYRSRLINFDPSFFLSLEYYGRLRDEPCAN